LATLSAVAGGVPRSGRSTNGTAARLNRGSPPIVSTTGIVLLITLPKTA
jgi:hypothetical protein